MKYFLFLGAYSIILNYYVELISCVFLFSFYDAFLYQDVLNIVFLALISMGLLYTAIICVIKNLCLFKRSILC